MRREHALLQAKNIQQEKMKMMQQQQNMMLRAQQAQKQQTLGVNPYEQTISQQQVSKQNMN